MRTKAEAAKLLLKSGWTVSETQSVLGNVLDEPVTNLSQTPWWTWVGEEWYTGGTQIVSDWEAWLLAGKP